MSATERLRDAVFTLAHAGGFASFVMRGQGTAFRVPTHLTWAERLQLYRLGCRAPAGSAFVEIGSYLGASALFLAEAARRRGGRVYCVDTWANEGMTEGPRDTFAEFHANTEAYRAWIKPLRGKSVSVARNFNDRIALLFVDGDHSYAGCLQDVHAWLGFVCDGGTVAFHDYAWAEGVRRAVHEVIRPLQIGRGHFWHNLYWARIRRPADPA